MKVSKIDPAIIQRILEEYPTTETIYLVQKYGVSRMEILSMAHKYGIRKEFISLNKLSHEELVRMMRDYYMRGYADAGGDLKTDTFKRFDEEIKLRISTM